MGGNDCGVILKYLCFSKKKKKTFVSLIRTIPLKYLGTLVSLFLWRSVILLAIYIYRVL